MAYSHKNGKYLVCLTKHPNCQVILLDAGRMKPVGQSYVLGPGYNVVKINPFDMRKISVSGNGNIKLIQEVENTLKELPDIIHLPKDNFVTHIWFDNLHLVAANDKGEICITKNKHFYQKIKKPYNIPNKVYEF